MSNLIRKQITDKNGNTALRWVKPDEAANAPTPVLPAPLALAKDRVGEAFLAALATDIAYAEAIAAERDGAKPLINYSNARSRLDALDNDTLRAIEKSIPAYEDGVTFVSELLMDNWEDEQTVREVLTFRGCFGEFPDVNEVLTFSKGLHEYPQFGKNDLSKLDDEDMSVARALCTVTTAIHHGLPSEMSPISSYVVSGGSRHLTDTVLVQAITAHPTRTDEVIQFMFDRMSIDGNTVKAYLENRTALREGVL